MSGVATDLHDPAGVATPAPPPGICVAGHFREGPRYRVRRPQGSRDWLLTHTVAGAGRYALGAAGWRAEPGDLCLLLPGAEHDYGTDGEHWEFWWAHFIPRPHWAPWLRWPALERGALRLRLAEARPRPQSANSELPMSYRARCAWSPTSTSGGAAFADRAEGERPRAPRRLPRPAGLHGVERATSG